MNIPKIQTVCGFGCGSSLMLRMNVEKTLQKIGISGVSVTHSSLSDAAEGAADLFVVGKDLENLLWEIIKYIKDILMQKTGQTFGLSPGNHPLRNHDLYRRVL